MLLNWVGLVDSGLEGLDCATYDDVRIPFADLGVLVLCHGVEGCIAGLCGILLVSFLESCALKLERNAILGLCGHTSVVTLVSSGIGIGLGRRSVNACREMCRGYSCSNCSRPADISEGLDVPRWKWCPRQPLCQNCVS